MIGRTFRPWLAPVVILTAGACFATRNDVRILQQDLQVIRAERAAGDSALRAQMEKDLARVTALLAELADTAHQANVQLNRLRGDLGEEMRSVRQQLIMIQELTGQSQRRIMDLRSELEARAAELAAPPPPDTTRGARPDSTMATRPSAPPGPAQLYQMGQDQLRRGSSSSARAAFLQLLTAHPTSDLAPPALYGVAETWADEGNGVAADSVYALVVQRYPRSDQAPNALYKRATAYRSIGQNDQAESLYRQIVDQYPRSDAALLAQEFLRSRRP
ncbi:MAG: tetratricopeptide repeat protein [Gemmatimonadaceae bacterium]|nr:tetratricopeptide repeat protein [Gemmatimonadaceae bacterium]